MSLLQVLMRINMQFLSQFSSNHYKSKTYKCRLIGRDGTGCSERCIRVMSTDMRSITAL
jgi:hypothetical protein